MPLQKRFGAYTSHYVFALDLIDALIRYLDGAIGSEEIKMVPNLTVIQSLEAEQRALRIARDQLDSNDPVALEAAIDYYRPLVEAAYSDSPDMEQILTYLKARKAAEKSQQPHIQRGHAQSRCVSAPDARRLGTTFRTLQTTTSECRHPVFKVRTAGTRRHHFFCSALSRES